MNPDPKLVNWQASLQYLNMTPVAVGLLDYTVLSVHPLALNPPLLSMNGLLQVSTWTLTATSSVLITEFSIIYSQDCQCYLVLSRNVAKGAKEMPLTSDKAIRDSSLPWLFLRRTALWLFTKIL